MVYSGNNPFLIISLLQTIFALFFYGGLNIPCGLISLTLTFCFYIFNKESFFLLNCLLSVGMLLWATKNPMLSNSAILLALSSCIFIYYFFKKPEVRNLRCSILMLVSVAYFVSGIHKMNAGFFYSSSSCVTSYLRIFLIKLGIHDISSFTSGSVAFCIVILELFLGLSFFIPRFRALAFYVMIGFQTLASFANPVVEPFGNLMISLVAISFWSDENSKRAPKFWKLIVFCVILILIDFYLHHLGLIKANVFPGIFTIIFFSFLCISGFPGTMKSTRFQFNFKNLLLPSFYFLFCLGGPYVGYRETGSLNMYSNLVPSSQGTNHFFLGKILPNLINPWVYRIKRYCKVLCVNSFSALKPRKGFLKSNRVSLPVNFHS